MRSTQDRPAAPVAADQTREPEPIYVRAEQAAKLLSVSEAWVNRRLADGTIPSRKLGGVRLIAVADLRRLSA